MAHYSPKDDNGYAEAAIVLCQGVVQVWQGLELEEDDSGVVEWFLALWEELAS